MQRNFMLMLAVALTLGLSACNDAAPKIAVIDAEKVYQGSVLAKQGMAYIEGLSKSLNERIAEMRDEMTASRSNEALGQKLQEELAGLQKKFEEEQTAAAEKLNKLFEETLEEYRQKNKLEAILLKQVVLTARQGADVTEEVTKLFDSKSVQFGTAPAVAPAASEAAAPAGAPAAAELNAAQAKPAADASDAAEKK